MPFHFFEDHMNKVQGHARVIRVALNFLRNSYSFRNPQKSYNPNLMVCAIRRPEPKPLAA
jgi:hypothetical protein